jgi:hypothetical protein
MTAWGTQIPACIAEYSPASPNSFQDVANTISTDYANGAMNADWKYYNFLYNAPATSPSDGLDQYVGSAVLSLTSDSVQTACFEAGTLFYMDYPDLVNYRGRLWFIVLSDNVPWPPEGYPS